MLSPAPSPRQVLRLRDGSSGFDCIYGTVSSPRLVTGKGPQSSPRQGLKVRSSSENNLASPLVPKRQSLNGKQTQSRNSGVHSLRKISARKLVEAAALKHLPIAFAPCDNLFDTKPSEIPTPICTASASASSSTVTQGIEDYNGEIKGLSGDSEDDKGLNRIAPVDSASTEQLPHELSCAENNRKPSNQAGIIEPMDRLTLAPVLVELTVSSRGKPGTSAEVVIRALTSPSMLVLFAWCLRAINLSVWWTVASAGVTVVIIASIVAQAEVGMSSVHSLGAWATAAMRDNFLIQMQRVGIYTAIFAAMSLTTSAELQLLGCSALASVTYYYHVIDYVMPVKQIASNFISTAKSTGWTTIMPTIECKQNASPSASNRPLTSLRELAMLSAWAGLYIASILIDPADFHLPYDSQHLQLPCTSCWER